MENQQTLTPASLLAAISDGTPQEIIQRYALLPKIASEMDFGPFDNDLVVLDTEATGLSFHHDELTEIAAARVEHGEVVDWYTTFVNPGKPIPEDIEHLTGISDADVADAPTPAEALAGLVEFVGTSTIVAHNTNFDRTFTTRHVEGYPLLDNLWVDSLDLARIALPRLRGHRLIDLVHAFETVESTHRADDDVAATCAMLRILLAGVSEMPASLVREIARLATREEWPTVAVFEWFDRKNAAHGDVLPLNLKEIRRARLQDVPREKKLDAMDIVQSDELELSFPADEEVESAFSSDGAVGSLYSRYESRPEQVEMSLAVLDALRTSGNLVIEAGTGVGKSMAYLLPMAMVAKTNKITVGVATKTNALLDQLVYHELPALADALDGLTYAPLKGFSHYLCLNKVVRLVEQGVAPREVKGEILQPAASMATLLSFIEQTGFDDVDSLKINFQALPRWNFTTTSHDCLRRKCPFYGGMCFVHGARRMAENADVVVTNHALLFCDIQADGGLLPPIRHWVIDEAHGAEAEARRAFSLSLEAESLAKTAASLAVEESVKNPFVRAERQAVLRQEKEQETLFYALTAKAKKLGREFSEAAGEFAAHMKDLLFFDQLDKKKKSPYETVELWLSDGPRGVRDSATFRSVAEYGQALMTVSEKLVSSCQEIVGYLEDADDAAAVQREIASLAMKCKDILRAGEVILGPPSTKYAYSATLNKKKDRMNDKLEALLYNVGDKLEETLYADTLSVVFASATLSVDGSFESFEKAMGLNQHRFCTAETMQLASSFHFDEQMEVFIVRDMPEPSSPHYLAALEDLLLRAHIAQNGSMLTLFTNRKEMETSYDAIIADLRKRDLRAVCQKWGVSVKGLRDEFIADEHLSLFALKSFWDGFDAPGATLKGVIIPKLPFNKPSDPLSCERNAQEENAWARYVLPAAVIDVKQAVGRLIRTSTDEGVVIFADSRMATKFYGKVFQRSLPSSNITICSADEVIARLERRNV